MKRELEVALALAREAGAEAVRLRDGGLVIEMKPGDEPVTHADKRASELILAGLARAFPDDPVISEEAPPPPGALAATRKWFVDPIDGTKDFIRGTDGFAVMIGLVIDGRPALGVVYQPTLDRMFHASPEGAFVWTSGGIERLAVSTVATAGETRLVSSASHRTSDHDQIKQTLGIGDELAVGSVGVKLCLIAMGVRDLYVNPSAKTKAWDTCAPEAILVAAGGRLTDLFDAPIAYDTLPQLRGLVGSNGVIHDEVVGRLGSLFRHLS